LENCQIFEISNFRLEKSLNFQNFKFHIWKIAECQIWKITEFQIWNIVKFQIWKFVEFQIWKIPQPAKAPLRVLLELNYGKAAFLKSPGTKQGPLVGFWLFVKSKAPKKSNQTYP
jgi:hypothetical protein